MVNFDHLVRWSLPGFSTVKLLIFLCNLQGNSARQIKHIAHQIFTCWVLASTDNFLTVPSHLCLLLAFCCKRSCSRWCVKFQCQRQSPLSFFSHLAPAFKPTPSSTWHNLYISKSHFWATGLIELGQIKSKELRSSSHVKIWGDGNGFGGGKELGAPRLHCSSPL